MASTPKPLPNVLILLTDDQGYSPMGCHGHPFVQTPNTDAFHSAAIRFSDFHSGSTCAPTRSGLMTGHWCNSTGVWHTIGGRSLLRKDEYSLANALKDAGYSTGIFGKWHLGDEYPYRPQDRGFETVVIHGGGGVGQQPDWWGNDYFDDTYAVGPDGEKIKFEGYCTDVFFQEGLKFVEANAREKKPFFCYLATNAPHGPFNVEKKYRDMYKDQTECEDYARFLGMITNLDENFGLLRQRLQQLHIEDDTILVFMSDNGQCVVDGCKQGEQFNSGMRGYKGSEYEGGHRVPFFLRYPAGNFGQGRTVTELTSYVDVMPTLLDLCGVTPNLPESHPGFHGDSLVPLLHGGNDAEKSTYWKERIVVTDTQRIPHPIKWRMCSVMRDKWRLVNRTELYNLVADPGQLDNIAGQHPDLVEVMHRGYEEWWQICDLQGEEIPLSIGAKDQEVAVLRSFDMRNENGDVVWSQSMVRGGKECMGWWEVHVEQDGVYEFELRRWPEEAGHSIRDGIDGTDIEYRESDVSPTSLSNYTGGKALNVQTACLIISGMEQQSQEVNETDKGATFSVQLKNGPTHIRAFFSSDVGGYSGEMHDTYMSAPYYTYVRLTQEIENWVMVEKSTSTRAL